MTMILSWINHVDSAVLSASSEVLAVENLKEPIVGRRWRSLAQNFHMLADLGAPKEIAVLALRFPRDGAPLPKPADTIRHRLDDAVDAVTQHLLFSQDMTGETSDSPPAPVWSLTGTTIDTGRDAPDGTNTANGLLEDSSTGAHRDQQIADLAPSQTMTASRYVKPLGRNFVRLIIFRVNTPGDRVTGVFNIATGAVVDTINDGAGSGAKATITPVPGTDFYRISITGQPSTAGTDSILGRLAATMPILTRHVGLHQKAFVIRESL